MIVSIVNICIFVSNYYQHLITKMMKCWSQICDMGVTLDSDSNRQYSVTQNKERKDQQDYFVVLLAGAKTFIIKCKLHLWPWEAANMSCCRFCYSTKLFVLLNGIKHVLTVTSLKEAGGEHQFCIFFLLLLYL